jgi:4-amino-4-deoxy-L-arabinose transferase-like glycosyltransferase
LFRIPPVKAAKDAERMPGIPSAPATTPAIPIKRAGRLPQAVVVLGVALGVGLRLWTMSGPAGAINSDTAVVGLMARHMLHGQFQAFYWGQPYGGSQEAALAAALFGIVGSSAFVLRLSMILWSAVSAVLVWRIGKATVGEPAATIGALLFWVWPAESVRLSVIQTGGHWPALTFALGALLVVLRVRSGRAEGPGWFLLLGLLAGLSVWASPEAAYVLLPTAIFFAPALMKRWRHIPLAVMGLALGALPWLYNNINHGWASLHYPVLVAHDSYLDHLKYFFQSLLPLALGMREPSLRWFASPVGQVVVVAAVTAFVVALVRFRPRLRLLLILVATFPFLFAFNKFAYQVVDGRYGLFLGPPIALLLAAAVTRSRRAIATIATAVVITVIGLYPIVSTNVQSPTAVPGNDHDLLTLLATNHVRYAYASYWIAFRVTFETKERVVVDPTFASRYPPYDAVRSHPDAAYVFLKGAGTRVRFFAYCYEHAIPLTVTESGVFTVAIPGRQVLPEQVTNDWLS